MTKVMARLKEPSTWAGIGILATMFGVPAAIIPVIAKVGAAVTAVCAILLPENSAK